MLKRLPINFAPFVPVWVGLLPLNSPKMTFFLNIPIKGVAITSATLNSPIKIDAYLETHMRRCFSTVKPV